MLTLTKVKKIYAEKSDSSVEALKDITLSFRPNEFVSILGPSGCGKTTLLNIIGGLDRYSDGDLLINGTSTKTFKDRDWDTYRNHSIGFVFQSYNLIPHQTILENVELTMTLGGMSKAERKKRAKEALISVGLKSKINKKPNQLSGGQMQRVSIARALVGNPDIILADEPTGALDSETSQTVMELLKEISKTRLVIMVTHNPDLAERYSDRIIKMLDGKVTDDSKPYDGISEEKKQEVKSIEEEIKYKKRHSSMSFLTALKLSGKNLLSKKRRTAITSIAASIGIIGIAVILSVSAGLSDYIDQTMLDSASFNFLSINSTYTEMSTGMGGGMMGGGQESVELPEYPENTTGIYPYEPTSNVEAKKQKLDSEFISYLEEKSKDYVIDIAYTYNVDLNILTKNSDKYVAVSDSAWGESLNNAEYLTDKYTVLAKADSATSGIPSQANEIALVVDKYNRLSTDTLKSLGIEYSDDLSEIEYSALIGKEFRVVYNDGWYTESDGVYRAANTTNYGEAYENENGITVKIISVLREEKDAPSSWLSSGIAYTPALTELVLDANKDSAVAVAQAENTEINVTTGTAFTSSDSGSGSGGIGGGMGGIGGGMQTGGSDVTYESMLESLGYTQTPYSITVYPIDVAAKNTVMQILDDWNAEHKDTDAVVEYTDMSSIMTSMLGTIVDIITYVLVAFSVVSLVISSIMIAIIIYASVIERTKEIGVLRSIGARKKDISRVFKAEAIILGVVSGVVAIFATLLINLLINAILGSLLGVSGIASLSPLTAILLILLSAVLLLIASLIPARMAAKKQPADALRSE